MKYGYRGKEIMEPKDWVVGVAAVLVLLAFIAFLVWQKDEPQKGQILRELQEEPVPEKTLALKVPTGTKCQVFDQIQDRILVECIKPAKEGEKK